jgi:dihydroorotate dehydrogenase
MLPYSLVRPILFGIDAERAHDTTLKLLAFAGAFHVPVGIGAADPREEIEVMGLRFPNRVGLAAGLDKNGVAVDGLAGFGFGFIEVGTVTPRPQDGNPKPRLFRLPEYQAIINRMGFNNAGIDALISNVAKAKYKGVLGINIGKNAATPMEAATADYLIGLDKAYPYAGYVTINISSPNTKNLRQLQGEAELDSLLGTLKRRQAVLADTHSRYVPLVLKIAPDLDDAQISHIADALRRHKIDGVIATNTTLSRDGVTASSLAQETGGLSGAPLYSRSTAIVKAFSKAIAGELPIIAAGGIDSGAKAQAKLDAGASLVQLYSGLIYRGPSLVRECVRATAQVSRR